MIQYVKIMIHVLYTHIDKEASFTWFSIHIDIIIISCAMNVVCVLYAYYRRIAQVLQGYHTQILSTYCCPALYIYMCVCVRVCV